MKVVILAGGLGTRLAEYTKTIPKPMVKILNVPIIERIIRYYNKFGFEDFLIAGGYKQTFLKKYFKRKLRNLSIKVIDTGKKTMTGGRIKRIYDYVKNDDCLK